MKSEPIPLTQAHRDDRAFLVQLIRRAQNTGQTVGEFLAAAERAGYARRMAHNVALREGFGFSEFGSEASA